MTFSSQRIHALRWKKKRFKQNINESKTESKMENPTHSFTETNLRQESQIKSKNGIVGARERKKRPFFVPFILFERNFFNLCVVSQCIVY